MHTTDAPPFTETPVADAGVDQSVAVGETVSLDGSASRDPDQGPRPLAYLWTQTGGPEIVTLNDAKTAAPSFVPTTPGTYAFSLTVGDGLATGPADSVSIAVEDVPLQLLSPNGGETWQAKIPQTLRWYASANLTTTWKPVFIRFSKQGGRHWKTVKIARARAGSIQWKPKLIHRSPEARIQICMMLNGRPVCDTSRESFVIRR